VWEVLLEWCAGLFGLTKRDGRTALGLGCLGLFLLGLTLAQRMGFAGWLFPGFLLALAAFAASDVIRARNAMRRAAQLPLDDPRQRPDLDPSEHLTSTATTLRRLGAAIDDARRARYADANDALPRIDRSLLRDEELRLLDAVRAMISLGLGDTRTAAQHALTALPTGIEELDMCLGRVVIADAWQQPDRLRAIQIAWDTAGIAPDQDGPLARLHRLTRLRIDERLLESVSATEARTLSTEARAVGDEDFAADLESRARESAYR
jgi:hypothetical protein